MATREDRPIYFTEKRPKYFLDTVIKIIKQIIKRSLFYVMDSAALPSCIVCYGK